MADSDLSRCLIYGAYGYTGDLIARLAASRGLKPILAGRSEAKLTPLATELGLPHRTVGLDDPAALDAALEGVDVVLHCAGPFSRTSAPMVQACLRTATHYLDITGEIGVFMACHAQSAAAAKAGIMVMPGTGFDIVPSDCLAAHLASRLPSATHLTLAFANQGGGMSHGTATTAVENLDQPNLVRRDGELVKVPTGSLRRQIDFGKGPRLTMAIPWGDVYTAHHSTGIPNTEVYIRLPKSAIRGARVASFVPWLMKSGPVQKLLKRRVDSAPAGPTAEARAAAHTMLWGEARDGDQVVTTRMRTPEGYTLTAATALEIAVRTLAGDFKTGYQTPSTAYGADFILGFDGVTRTDLDGPNT